MSGVIISKKIQYLKFFAIGTLILSAVEILLMSGYVIYSESLPSNYIVYLKFLFLISDILLIANVLRLIREYYPAKALSRRIQYFFLILAYISLFGIVVYLAVLFDFFDMLLTVEPYAEGVEVTEDLLLTLILFGFILIKIVSLVYTQVNGFRLIKEIRNNFRESLIGTSDLL